MALTLGGSPDPEMVALADQVLASGERTENDLRNFATPVIGLVGNSWNLSAERGWRWEAQKWGEGHDLVQRDPEHPAFIGFTERGERFKRELERRGLTLLS
jgi:hypothetical protein